MSTVVGTFLSQPLPPAETFPQAAQAQPQAVQTPTESALADLLAGAHRKHIALAAVEINEAAGLTAAQKATKLASLAAQVELMRLFRLGDAASAAALITSFGRGGVPDPSLRRPPTA